MTRSEWRELGKGLAFLSPWLIGFLGLTLLPAILSFYYSFCDYSLLQKPAWMGLTNYRNLLWAPNAMPVKGLPPFGDPIFWKAMKNTLTYAAIVLPAGLIMSLGLALLLNIKIKSQPYYRTIIFLPTLVPTIASAMVWLWLYNDKLGLFNALLLKVGMKPVGWLSQPEIALTSIALMSLWGVGNAVVIYLAGLQDVPVELYEAAEIDGAGPVQRMWNVTLPMLSPVIFFNLIMAIIGTLQVFNEPFIMTSGGPVRATYMLTQYLYENAFLYLKMGYASAMAWLQLLIVLALTGLAFGLSKRWVHYHGE
jgi:multiple sugar transport system permease protein